MNASKSTHKQVEERSAEAVSSTYILEYKINEK